MRLVGYRAGSNRATMRAMSHRICGTCGHFQVRPSEVELARAAKPMSACGPGAYCFGGPVRGYCRLWETQIESTASCAAINKPDRWCPGGPTIAGYDAAACPTPSGSRATLPRLEPSRAASAVRGVFNTGTLLAAAAVVVAGVVGEALPRWKGRR